MKSLRILTGIIIISITAYAVVTYAYFRSSATASFNRNINSILYSEEHLIKSIIARIEDEALGIAISISDREEVKNAYRITDENKAVAVLESSIAPLIEKLSTGLEHDEFKIHFHKPPAVSFLRTWRETRGEDLSGYRGSIIHTYNTGETVKCIEIGRAGLAVRGLAPVFDGPEYLGSVDVLFGIQDVVSFIKENNPDLNFIVIASREKMDQYMLDEEKGEYYLDTWNRHIVIANTLSADRKIEDNLEYRLDNEVTEDLRIFRTDKNTVANLNIHDFSGETIGHFLFFFDNETAVKETNRFITLFTVINFAICVLIIILFLQYFRRIRLQFLKYNNLLKTEIDQKNRFFSIIAHDLRSPFNALIGLSKILIYDEVSEDMKNKFIEAIHESSLKGLDLLENLLHWASSQTGELKLEFRKINLEAAVNEAEQLLTLNLMQKKINFIKEIPSDIFVNADQNCLTTILRNLISNSIKFTKPGGTIIISSERYNGRIACSISDSGVGMTDEQQKTLFSFADKVSTNGTKNEQGAGIGLIIVKDFVGKCGGYITVKSKKEEGTTFTFYLPEFFSDTRD